MNQIQTYIEKIKREVESEYEMGGLSDGLYGDYASEVARRSISKAYEELIETIQAGEKSGRYERDENESYMFSKGYTSAVQEVISYLKGRIEEVKKSETKELK